MDMHFREFEHILLVIALVRGFIAPCSVKGERPDKPGQD
jgi:hypothetical protein